MNSCIRHRQCIENAIRDGEKICQEKQLRFTDTRRKVLEIIWESHKPSKAYDILDKLGNAPGSSQPPTVYRALDFLLDTGLVHKINTLNAFVGCTHPKKHHQCHFLICTKCENVYECCSDSLTEAILKTAQAQGFKALNSSIEIQGICEDCMQGMPA